MNKNLQKYIDAKKCSFLISEGLYERVWENESVKHDATEYPYVYRFNDKIRYYKVIPYEMTDEEFKMVLSLHNVTNKKKNTKLNSSIVLFIRIVASLIIVAGLIACGITAKLNPVIAIECIIASIICGSSLFCISEIIRLLHSIDQKL